MFALLAHSGCYFFFPPPWTANVLGPRLTLFSDLGDHSLVSSPRAGARMTIITDLISSSLNKAI